MFYSNKKSSSAEVNSCCFSAISQFLQEHISHFPNQIPLAMPTCSAHVFMFLQTPFHWVWWQMTEWRREYFDILPQYCSRLGVLLASISNMFCVACGLTGFHSHLLPLPTLTLQPKDWMSELYQLSLLVILVIQAQIRDDYWVVLMAQLWCEAPPSLHT